jgi:hypothetical protein
MNKNKNIDEVLNGIIESKDCIESSLLAELQISIIENKKISIPDMAERIRFINDLKDVSVIKIFKLLKEFHEKGIIVLNENATIDNYDYSMKENVLEKLEKRNNDFLPDDIQMKIYMFLWLVSLIDSYYEFNTIIKYTDVKEYMVYRHVKEIDIEKIKEKINDLADK